VDLILLVGNQQELLMSLEGTIMETESSSVAGKRQTRNSIISVCLTSALLLSTEVFIGKGAVKIVFFLAAIGIVVVTLRGLPDALIRLASRKRGSTYFKGMSLVLPIAAFLISAYLIWVFWRIQNSELIQGVQYEIVIGLLVIACLLNLTVFIKNVVTSN
jgi:hypothetical protein